MRTLKNMAISRHLGHAYGKRPACNVNEVEQWSKALFAHSELVNGAVWMVNCSPNRQEVFMVENELGLAFYSHYQQSADYNKGVA